MSHLVAPLLLSLALAGALASVALAAEPRALTVSCKGTLPFDQPTLRRAIALRLPLMRVKAGGLALEVQVKALPPDGAVIRVSDSSRLVSLKGLSPVDATRVVALLSLDLISLGQDRDELSQSEPEPSDNNKKSKSIVFIGLSPRLSLGAVAWSPTFEPTVDLNMMVSPHLLIFIEAGFTWAEAGDEARVLDLIEVPLRAGGGVRYRWFEARAGLALRPYRIDGAGDDSGVLAGGALGLYFRHALSSWITGYAAVGLDVVYPRKEFRVGGQTVLTTSWATPWLGLGAGWTGG